MNGHPSTSDGRLGVLLAILDFPMLSLSVRAAVDAERDMHVVGVIEDSLTLRGRIGEILADVVIVGCPLLDGDRTTPFEAIQAIRAARPALKIVALESRSAGRQFPLAFKAGADAFLTRDAQATDIVSAVRCVSRGQTYVSPSIATRMVNTYVLRSSPCPLEDAYDALNDREREVLLLAAIGHSNRDIAATLHVSEQTVRNHRAGVMQKLGFRDRVDMLKYAIRRGVIDVAEP